MSTVEEEIDAQWARVFELNARAFGGDLEGPRSTAAPQEAYVDLMARCPVRDLGNGFFSVTSMADVQFINRHPDVLQGTKYLGSDRPAIPLGIDGPEHRKYRKLLDPVFSPTRIAPLAGRVEKLAADLIESFVDRGRVDAYHEWCEPLPSSIFLSIMGLPQEQLDDFIRFKDYVLSNEEAPHLTPEELTARRHEGVAWLNSYFNAELEEREKHGDRDDMIGWLISTEVDAHRLDRDEMLGILGLLMIAGLDTVAASLACALSFLARHSQDRQRLVADPSLWRSAVEELLRFESPVTEGSRKVMADLTLPSGMNIPAGSMVSVSWSAANLDPEVFSDPLGVDLERNPNPHIAFASGYHRCLGSHLARMELAVALEVWHRMIPNYRIADGVELFYSGNPRAPHRMELVWD